MDHTATLDTAAAAVSTDAARYARCIESAKRIRWDIEQDATRGRKFDFSRRLLPEGLARVSGLSALNPDEQRMPNRVQGRAHADRFGLVEHFNCARFLEISSDHWFGDQLMSVMTPAEAQRVHMALQPLMA